MSENLERTETIERLKQQIFTLVRDEVVNNRYAFPDGIEEVLVLNLDSRGTIVFPASVDIQSVSPDFPVLMNLPINELKRFTYDNEFGAWISFSLFINLENNTSLFTFNYDEEKLQHNVYGPLAWSNELALFPRFNQNIPAWWKAKLPSEDSSI